MKVIDPPKLRTSPLTLESGDCMTRAEFHEIYAQMPAHFKAELIGGIVYVASPLRLIHGTSHPFLSAVMLAYQAATPGVQLGDNTTILLSDDSEPQPDLFLRILPQYGGRTRDSHDGYVDGPPEFAVEIAHSSKSIDLNQKHHDYAENGIPEYLVYVIDEQKFRWFDLQKNQELHPQADRIFKIGQFAGLWIDEAAVVTKDYGRMMGVLQLGLAAPEHAQFTQGLVNARTGA